MNVTDVHCGLPFHGVRRVGKSPSSYHCELHSKPGDDGPGLRVEVMAGLRAFLWKERVGLDQGQRVLLALEAGSAQDVGGTLLPDPRGPPCWSLDGSIGNR